VLLLSHGGGTTTAMHAAQASDLASHGYVVAAVDHPGDALVADVGGGRLVARGGAMARPERAYMPRVRDMRLVLDRLPRLRGVGRLDLRRIGAFGHSAGGATAAGAMLADRRIDAGIDVDGSLHGDVVKRGLDRPFGVVVGDHLPVSAYGTLEPFRRHLRGPKPLARFAGHGHHAFTDEVFIVPQLGIDPVAAEVGTVDPASAVAEQRSWVRAFFDRHVAR
jgi:dienelactone hydrolase